MRDEDKLKCTNCGSDLELSIAFDGCDWDSTQGEGSGFDYTVSLECVKYGCGRIYPIGRVKDERGFCENKEELRPYRSEEQK